MASVLQPWLSNLSLKNQTLLLSAIRGPDGVAKNNKVKDVLKFYRACVLKEADNLSGFMDFHEPERDVVRKFVQDIEEYPLHWVMHFYRACAILSREPDGDFWQDLYFRLAARLHLNPQTPEQVEYSI